MPSLKDYRDRIASVKSTRKITSAMKMVAASKLKRAQTQAEESQPYAKRMGDMLARLISNTEVNEASPVLLAGTGADQTHLLVLVTSDRGLCGGFNAFIVRKARQQIAELQAAGKEFKMICVGRKGYEQLKSEHEDKIIKRFEGPGKKGLSYQDADEISQYVLDLLEAGEFDVCSVLFNRFKNVISQVPTAKQVIPVALEETEETETETTDTGAKALCEFEPNEDALLADLLPRNLGVQIFNALLDSAAGEQAARMTAMDNATRNAGDRIDQLTLTYNRARQAYITKELIEIISGAEAV